MFGELKPGNQPTVVWLADPTNEKVNQNIDGTIFRAEPVGIALKHFNCLKVNVQEIPDAELQKKYMKEAPAFYFFDPAAKLVANVTGKRANSLSGFTKLMEATWDKSFTMTLKEFSKKYKEILDSFDKIDVKQQAVTRDKQKLEEKPNPQLKREVETAEAEIAAEKAKVEQDEKKILESCALRPEFQPQKPADSE
ncbi:MAG: hypothetical protein MUE73_15730 [Planctomycetes bacterium]|jgi:hypothetical protein|nr:hypothetical protein [Planctomycetota bacterium]